MHDSPDEKEDREDLHARLLGAQALGHFLLRAYEAYRTHRVDFMALPEWSNKTMLEEAKTLRPHHAQSKIVLWFERLENALTAALRRKSMRLLHGGHSKKDDHHE